MNIKLILVSFLLLIGVHLGKSQTLPVDIVIDQYNSSQTDIKAVRSITLKPTSSGAAFIVPAGSNFRASVYPIDQYLPEPESNQNFVKVEDMMTTDPISTNYINQKKLSYQYFDGLGRPIQSVDVKGSITQNDIVVSEKYDIVGRKDKEYLSFSSFPGNGLYKSDGITSLLDFYSPSRGEYNNKVKTDASPVSSTSFEPSPLNRVLAKSAVGSDWQQAANTQRFDYLMNVDGSATGQETIPVWTLNSVTINGALEFIISTTRNQPTGSLYIKTTTDENGKQIREYVDKEGRTLVKKLQYTSSVPQTFNNSDWLITHYLYDDFGLLRFVLQPEFILNFGSYTSASNDDKRTWLGNFAFEYRYDERGRVVYKKIPGARPVDMVYDKWDRLILSRDGNQKTRGVWYFTKYDALNRSIMVGEVSSSSSQSTMADNVRNLNNRFENVVNGNNVGYSLDQTYPTTISINDVFMITYYDDYSFKGNLGLGTAYDYSGPYLTNPKGLVTGTKVRVLDSSPVLWLMSADYYDDRYRLKYSIMDDHLGNKNKTTNTYYGITSLMTSSKLEHGSNLTTLTETEYDHRGRATNIYETINSNARVLMVSNKYNELGQQVEKNVHSTDGGASFLQSSDYRYNIRGWLTHINNSALSNDGAYNDDTNDLFGMELKYNTGVTVGSDAIDPQYNGNISSMAWKTNNLVDASVEKIYGFKYDPVSRLKDAKYATKNGVSWNATLDQFNEDNISYDRNGNIMHLDRRSVIGGSNVYIDQLGYSYSGNQVTNIIDSSPYDNVNSNGVDFGFREIMQVTGLTEYRYDENGNMKEDGNKGVISVSYNHLNLPKRVELEPQSGLSRTIDYTYSASGVKLRKVAKIGTQVISQSDYVGDVQYEKGQLAFIMGPEGRMIKNGNEWQYEYHLKDHLGNTRVAYGILKNVDDYKASMETELATREEAKFTNLTAALRSIDYNHTKPNADVSVPNESVKLNGFTGTPVGPAKMLQVKNGDRITMETFAYCPIVVSSNAIVPGIAVAVTGAFGLTTVGEASYQALSGQVPVTAGAVGRGTNLPKAYLCYLLFNNNYGFVQHGFYSVGSESQIAFQQLALDVTVPTDGYMYIYVANESNVSATSSAYFDDLSITHFKNSSSLQVVQAQDYYPFGLTFNAYQRESSIENNYLYNQGTGEKIFKTERIYDLGLNVDLSKYRTFDYVTGRWWQEDPLADEGDLVSYSPYNYSFNNPIRYNDPDGDCPWCIGALVGAVTDYAVQVATNVVANGGEVNLEAFTNVDVGSIALSAVTGAAGVGIANGFSKLATVGKLGQLASKSGTVSKIVKTGTDVAGDATSSVVGSLVQGNDVTVEGVVADVVGGAVGRKIETKVKSVAQNSPQGKALQRDANRAQRLGGSGARQSRQLKAAASSNKANNYGASKAATAGAAGSNATSKAVSVVTKAVEKKDDN